MPPRLQVVIGVLFVVLVGVLLWPIFAEGEPWLPVALLAFLVAAAGLVFIALKGSMRWSRYALLGTLPGFLIGGFGLGAVVWFGSDASGGGWEGLVAVVAGILGAFIGSIAGSVAGGLIGYSKDRQAHHER